MPGKKVWITLHGGMFYLVKLCNFKKKKKNISKSFDIFRGDYYTCHLAERKILKCVFEESEVKSVNSGKLFT